VEGGDGGGVPEVGVGKVDDHARRGVQVVEAVGELHRAGEEHLAPHAVGAAAVGGVLVLDVQHRADPAGEGQRRQQHAGQDALGEVAGGDGDDDGAEHDQV